MATKSETYQAMFEELNELLARMQTGELGVDEAMKAYDHGQKLVAQLTEYLKKTENEVTIRKPLTTA